MRRGRKAGRRLLSVHALVDDGASRAGFVVGRSVGGSVERHRVTRRLRHLLADRLDYLPAGTALVVRAHPAAAGAGSARPRAGPPRPPRGGGGPPPARPSTPPCGGWVSRPVRARSVRHRSIPGPATRLPRPPRGTGRAGARVDRPPPGRRRSPSRPDAGSMGGGTGREARDRTSSGHRDVVPRETDGSGRRGDGDTAGRHAAARPRHPAGDRAPRGLPALDLPDVPAPLSFPPELQCLRRPGAPRARPPPRGGPRGRAPAEVRPVAPWRPRPRAPAWGP